MNSDRQTRLSILDIPAPSDEAIAKHFADSLQSFIEVFNMDLAILPEHERCPWISNYLNL